MSEKRQPPKRPRRAKGGKTKNKPTINASPWDHGATGPANREGLIEEPATEIDPETGREARNPNKVTRMRRRDWIDTYLLQGKLTLDQIAIARELRDASEGARNADPLAALSSQIDRQGAAPDPQAAAYDSRRKFRRMWALVPDYAQPIIERVVIENQPANGVSGRGRSTEKHMDMLRKGLDELRKAWPVRDRREGLL